MIFAPILSEPKRSESTEEAAEPQQELLGFRSVRVFVAQTEGEELTEVSLFDKVDLAATLAKLMEFADSQEIKIEYSDNIAPAKATSFRGVIRLMPDMEAGETVSGFVRELAVQMLYETKRRSFVTRDVLLREAKAVAFVVGEALHLEQEPAENINLYRGNLNLLAESLEVVQRTAAVILGAFSDRVRTAGTDSVEKTAGGQLSTEQRASWAPETSSAGANV